ncbi:sodium bile acid symporter family-domain-containing protein, partial [Papiliotrema laurentii]
MLAVAWATLPDLPTYRTGVIMVGLARCIAMVMIWNHLAHGDGDYCAILVIINSILQIVLYSPMSLFFINIISGETACSLNTAGRRLRIILIFAGQATRILDNIGDVFRVVVPMTLYFVVMWTSAFFLVYYSHAGQSFTAGSNNFELAIAVCVA